MTYTEGETFALKSELTAPYIGYPGYGPSTKRILSGTQVQVKKVNADTLWVRGVANGGKPKTLILGLDVAEEYLGAPDPNAPKPRKIGEVPEGGIPADDPRIAWIFEDAAKVASKAGYCSTYDAIADKIGIPGRVRKFTITRKVGGFSVRRDFSANSKKAAEALFDAELAASGLAPSPQAVTA